MYSIVGIVRYANKVFDIEDVIIPVSNIFNAYRIHMMEVSY